MVWKIKQPHKDRDQKEKKESNQLLQTYASIKDWSSIRCCTPHWDKLHLLGFLWNLNAWQEFSTLLGKNIYLCSTQSIVWMYSPITNPKGFPTTSAKLELNHSEVHYSLGRTQRLSGTAFSKDWLLKLVLQMHSLYISRFQLFLSCSQGLCQIVLTYRSLIHWDT